MYYLRGMRDADVRAAVKQRLSGIYAGDPDTRIVDEMGIWSGTVRIDIAVINRELSGFELKSDSDTLQRLPYQIKIYSKVFDRVSLVVGTRHHERALALIPSWWGCMTATMREGKVVLKRARKGRRNPAPDPSVVAAMLWKDEAVQILDAHGLAKGWRTKPVAEIRRRLVSELSFTELAGHMRSALKARKRLGQLASGEFDVPINGVANPTGGGPRRKAGLGGNSGDHSITPAMLQGGAPWGCEVE
jgi:hypothetical protein